MTALNATVTAHSILFGEAEAATVARQVVHRTLVADRAGCEIDPDVMREVLNFLRARFDGTIPDLRAGVETESAPIDREIDELYQELEQLAGDENDAAYRAKLAKLRNLQEAEARQYQTQFRKVFPANHDSLSVALQRADEVLKRHEGASKSDNSLDGED